MKLSALAAGLAAAGFAPALAMPLRVIMISGVDSSVAQAHPDHPVATYSQMAMPNQAEPGVARARMGRPCAGRLGAMRQKAVEISNAFRHALGLPAIEPYHSHKFGQSGRVIQVAPFVGASPTFIEVGRVNPDGSRSGRTRGGDKVEIVSSERNLLDYGWMRSGPSSPHNPGPHDRHGPNTPHGHIHHGPHHRPHHRPLNFFDRLHFSLMNLGPWEGRAVAFVLGCGIGVLLRMLWVFSVLAVRAIKGERREDEYTAIAIIDDLEHLPSSPPTYVYPVDEKISQEDVAKPAPSA